MRGAHYQEELAPPPLKPPLELRELLELLELRVLLELQLLDDEYDEPLLSPKNLTIQPSVVNSPEKNAP